MLEAFLLHIVHILYKDFSPMLIIPQKSWAVPSFRSTTPPLKYLFFLFSSGSYSLFTPVVSEYKFFKTDASKLLESDKYKCVTQVL